MPCTAVVDPRMDINLQKFYQLYYSRVASGREQQQQHAYVLPITRRLLRLEPSNVQMSFLEAEII